MSHADIYIYKPVEFKKKSNLKSIPVINLKLFKTMNDVTSCKLTYINIPF